MLIVWRFFKYKGIFAIILFLLIFFLLIYIDTNHSNKAARDLENIIAARNSDSRQNVFQSGKKLGILVPFRDRFDELLSFVPNISKFIRAQNAASSFKIYILNQSARYRFNRGALVNVGYLLAKNECDYISIHDVDLIPMNSNLSYSYPKDGPYHLSSPDYHPQYNYSKYFGGILLINNNHFESVNGMSNRYYGWGLEDDDFYARIKAAKLPVFRPQGLNTNRSTTFLHIHYNRRRDSFKTKEQRETLRRRDKITGLNDIKYSIASKHDLTINGEYNCTVFNVELFCDTKQTPWCLNSYGRRQSASTNAQRDGL